MSSYFFINNMTLFQGDDDARKAVFQKGADKIMRSPEARKTYIDNAKDPFVPWQCSAATVLDLAFRGKHHCFFNNHLK
jgi:hypothetical protein